MRCRAVVLVLVCLLLVAGAPAAAGPTSEDVCVGIGSMWTSASIYDSGFGPSVSADWAMNLIVGACVNTLSFSATGVFTGWCDYFSGYGITNQGHRFAFLGVGKRMLITGEVVGESYFIPDPLAGSCLSGASRFLVGVTGTVLRKCTVTGTEGTTEPVFGVPLHYKACV